MSIYHGSCEVTKPFNVWPLSPRFLGACNHCIGSCKIWTEICQSFWFLAYLSGQHGEPYFAIRPKLHMLHGSSIWLQIKAQRSIFCFNVLVESCSLDEDFVGRLAFLSRNVSPRLISQGSIERFLAQFNLHGGRSKEKQPKSAGTLVCCMVAVLVKTMQLRGPVCYQILAVVSLYGESCLPSFSPKHQLFMVVLAIHLQNTKYLCGF